jgi:hypothetical protein
MDKNNESKRKLQLNKETIAQLDNMDKIMGGAIETTGVGIAANAGVDTAVDLFGSRFICNTKLNSGCRKSMSCVRTVIICIPL